jgi:hypothetical protein
LQNSSLGIPYLFIWFLFGFDLLYGIFGPSGAYSGYELATFFSPLHSKICTLFALSNTIAFDCG